MVLNFRITIVLFIVLNTAYADFYLNCDDNPCKHGQCTDLYRKTAYQCNCDDGWEGENCDKSIDGANDNNQDKILDKYNYDNNNQDKNENDKVLDKTDDDQDLNKNSNPCGGECKNLGFCNEYSRRCECPERFTGEFCQFSSVHSGNIYDDYAECEKKCTTEDKSRKIDLGSTCDYNYFGSIKTCRCMGFKANSDSGHCLKMLESLEDCQKDCKANTDFAKNETRICTYYQNVETDSKDLKTCLCQNSSSDPCVENSMLDLIFDNLHYFSENGSFIAVTLFLLLVTVAVFCCFIRNGLCGKIFRNMKNRLQREPESIGTVEEKNNLN